MDWIKDLNKAIRYIEDNLTNEINAEDVASQIYLSSFHFQRMFGLLTGMTLGEYIRNRRLSMAGSELQCQHAKVIDTALKYGYETPESFTKAFTRFHGTTPKKARTEGVVLKSFSPLVIKVTLEGGNIMDYRIETKPAFDVLAMTRVFDENEPKDEIHLFWKEFFEKGYDAVVCGWFGICHEAQGGRFKYSIADPYQEGTPVPDGFEKISIPEATWAMFTCIGPMPETMHKMWRQIYSQWLPSSDYEIVPGYDVEYYSGPNTQDEDYLSEIWIPVKPREKKDETATK
jgi:AraC family transcriptional regulator